MYLLKENLKKIRLTLGYNQQQMADYLGIPIRTYMGYEYKAKVYPFDFLLKLTNLFNVNLHYVYTGEGAMFISQRENTLHKQANDDILKNLDTFYKRFNKLQKENELNDYQMAKQTGITESRIEKLGIGKVLPNLDELNALKAHFDVSVDWLLYGSAPCQNTQTYNESLTPEEISVLKKMAQKFNV